MTGHPFFVFILRSQNWGSNTACHNVFMVCFGVEMCPWCAAFVWRVVFFGPGQYNSPCFFTSLSFFSISMVSPHSNCWFLSLISSPLLPTCWLMRWHIFFWKSSNTKSTLDKTCYSPLLGESIPHLPHFNDFFPKSKKHVSPRVDTLW